MANTPNLDLVNLQTAQAQKEVTTNGNMAIIDSFAGVTAVAIVNGANTLTEAQSDAGIIVLTGALSTSATVAVNANVAKWTFFINATTGGQQVTITSGSGSVVVPYNSMQLVYSSASSVTGLGARPQTTLLSLSVAGGTNVTLTDAQGANRILQFTGALTGNINVVLPSAIVDEWTVFNNTTGAFTLTVKTSGGTGIAVGQGKRCILYCDGINVVRATADV